MRSAFLAEPIHVDKRLVLKMAGKLDGKSAIVTGASGGIGRATVLEFAQEGASVVVHYRSREKEANDLVAEVRRTGSKAFASKIDFMDVKRAEKETARTIEEAEREFGRIDVLVNLAGYPAKGEWNKRFLDLGLEDFRKPIDVDLMATFICSKLVAPHMLERKNGVIINVSSTPALVGHNKGFAFSVAKAAILGFTKSLAWELAPHVRVNAVAFGNIDTDWIEELTTEERRAAELEAPLKRLGSPREAARLLVFLASDDSGFVNGQTIVFDGGTVMR